MSQYSKRQEDRAEQKLKDSGFTLVEDTARRKKHHGDRVMEHPDTGLRLTIDHKSTRGDKGIRIEKEMLHKIRHEAAPYSIPVITFSFKNDRAIYIIFDIADLEGVMY